MPPHLALFALLLPAVGEAESRDSAGVRAAANDYLDGFCQGDSTKHIRSIHPSVAKVDGRWQIYHVMWQSPPLP